MMMLTDCLSLTISFGLWQSAVVPVTGLSLPPEDRLDRRNIQLLDGHAENRQIQFDDLQDPSYSPDHFFQNPHDLLGNPMVPHVRDDPSLDNPSSHGSYRAKYLDPSSGDYPLSVPYGTHTGQSYFDPQYTDPQYQKPGISYDQYYTGSDVDPSRPSPYHHDPHNPYGHGHDIYHPHDGYVDPYYPYGQDIHYPHDRYVEPLYPYGQDIQHPHDIYVEPHYPSDTSHIYYPNNYPYMYPEHGPYPYESHPDFPYPHPHHPYPHDSNRPCQFENYPDVYNPYAHYPDAHHPYGHYAVPQGQDGGHQYSYPLLPGNYPYPYTQYPEPQPAPGHYPEYPGQYSPYQGVNYPYGQHPAPPSSYGHYPNTEYPSEPVYPSGHYTQPMPHYGHYPYPRIPSEHYPPIGGPYTGGHPQQQEEPDGCEWKMIFKAVAGNHRSVYDDFTMPGNIHRYFPHARDLASPVVYRDGDCLDNWDHFIIPKVRVEVFSRGRRGVWVIFDGLGSTFTSWFNPFRILASSFHDIKSGNFSFFSVEGDTLEDTPFFMSRWHSEDCEGDCGYLAVIEDEEPVCRYKAVEPRPAFLYSTLTDTCAIFENADEVEYGDRFVVSVNLCGANHPIK